MNVYWLNKNPSMELYRGSSLRRYINSRLISFFKYAGWSKVYAYPRHLIIDIVNYCGLRCPICPQGMGLIRRKRTAINRAFFEGLIDQLGPYLYTMTLTNWGEPLLHPEIAELIRFARKYPIYIGFSSNLQHLPDSIVDPLLLSGVDEIACSIDGATLPVYASYRVGGDFHAAITNMRKLVNRKKELGVDLPKIRWQVLLNRHTEGETDAIIRLAKEWNLDSVVFVPIYVDIANMFKKSHQERFAADQAWMPKDPDLSWYDYSSGLFKNPPQTCTKAWETLVVHPDGAVSPCCAVIEPEQDFGTLTTPSDFWKVWNNRKYQSARKTIRSGSTSFENDTICSYCKYNGIVIY